MFIGGPWAKTDVAVGVGVVIGGAAIGDDEGGSVPAKPEAEDDDPGMVIADGQK